MDSVEVEQRVIKNIASVMEEYGMPVFVDRYTPAMDILQRIKDFGFIHRSKAVECCEVCEKCQGGYKLSIASLNCPACLNSGIVLLGDK